METIGITLEFILLIMPGFLLGMAILAFAKPSSLARFGAIPTTLTHGGAVFIPASGILQAAARLANVSQYKGRLVI
ncbi:MAG: hypothetical protein MUC76_12265 [Spirochaetes bacterium]|nr:hypothetical protein [Spirochaetota bacterium]